MNDDFLKSRLGRVARRYQWIGFWRKLAACWAGAALVGALVVWLQRELGQTWPLALPLIAAIAVGAATALGLMHFLKGPDYRWLAKKIEAKHPELDGVLLTAVQQQLDGSKEAGYLQYRVIQEATTRSQQQDWRDVVPAGRFLAVHAVHLVALGCFVFALAGLRVSRVPGEPTKWVGSDGIAVTPGDASVEKGESLVVLARFGGRLPPNVSMIVRESGAAPRTVPLVKSLADPVFGGSVTEVANDFTYHLEYRGEKTKEFKVKVYEHPKLVRSDVELTFPDYTKLAKKRIEDTRRVSAVEGTKLDFALQLNKPVKSAKLVSRETKGAKGEKTEKVEIPLVVSEQAIATLPNFTPQKSGVYELQLVDADGRANKVAAPFSIDVQPNRPPEIRLASPRGDVRPSALEEVTFEGTVWDDFGSPVYGLAYSVAGAETKYVELGRDTTAKEKRTFGHLINLEALKAKPDDLISWYAWADDIGPDGKVRRTTGDLYFAEVRPFDEIFRETQNMDMGEGGGGGGGGQQSRKLSELQKQIISATWKLQREGKTSRYAEDVKVVKDSQVQALQQAAEALGEARGPREQAMWKAVTQEMEKAVERLKEAASEPGPLAQALVPEQAAYQALLKLQARETAVTRRQRQQGGGGGGQQNQRQIDQLDLEQSENRYETQRLAKSPQNQERKEQLAVMNRLQELARRQHDLNERLKELQTALQEAKTEQEREEIKRRLKRLQEEQQQMLADVDELKQRMERPENQSRMAEERQQLEQTRDDLQKASEAAQQGSVSQALASGTRAQRQLQQLRDDMRKENSSQFAEDLREMRQEARQLAQRQEQLGQKLDETEKSGAQQRRSLSDNGDRKELLDQLAEQKEKMNRLVDRATQVSEQAENSEPLLSRTLYDSIRKVSQDDANAVKQAKQDLLNSGRMTRDLFDRLQRTSEREGGGKALDVTSELLREGYLPQARQAAQNVRSEVEELRKGVERAAESVLGDDAEQLKLAQSELDALTDALKRELAAADGQQKGKQGAGQRSEQQDARQASNERGEGQKGQQPGQAGEQGQEGQEGQSGEQGQRGQNGQGGDRQAANQRGAGQQPGQEQGQQGQEGQQGQGGEQQGQQPGQGGGRGDQLANNDQRPGQQQTGGGQQESEQQAQGGQQGGGGNEARGENDRGGRDQLADARNPRDPRGGRRPLSLEDLMRGSRDARGGDGAGGGGPNWGGEFGGFTGGYRDGPLTGEQFSRWNERLRDVEELLEEPDLRNAVAAARERARLMRSELRDLKKPDWTVVRLQILQPLVEVRSRVAEELARRDSKESLAPIDRDPVPNRFAESVRRYYEELGKDKAQK